MMTSSLKERGLSERGVLRTGSAKENPLPRMLVSWDSGELASMFRVRAGEEDSGEAKQKNL